MGSPSAVRSLVGVLLAGVSACSSAVIDLNGSAADPAAGSPPVSRGSGVLRAGFDPLTLAPESAPEPEAHEHGPGSYTCPHHPDVRSDVKGECPKCGMPLRFVPAEPSDHSGGHH